MEAKINGVTQRYTIDGPEGAPALTLAHALSLDMRSWAPQVAHFKDHYRVLCFDLRGHAKVDVDGKPFSVEDIAEDVIGLLDHLGIERTHYAGSSLGGMAGFALALDHPDRLLSLTLVATQGALPAERNHLLRENVAAMAADPRGLESKVDPMLDRLTRNGYREQDPDGYALLRDMATAGTVEGYSRACEACIAMNFDDRLEQIAVPTLVVAGAHDVATTPERMKMYRDRIPGARMAVLPSGAHFPNFDAPDEFNAALDEFLSGL